MTDLSPQCRRCRRRAAFSIVSTSKPSMLASRARSSTSVITCAHPGLASDARSTQAGHDEALACEQHVRRADDPVDRRLTGAVTVVEQCRLRVVDGMTGKPSAPSLQRPRRTPGGRLPVPAMMSPSCSRRAEVAI
jgi:hypothetical protein